MCLNGVKIVKAKKTSIGTVMICSSTDDMWQLVFYNLEEEIKKATKNTSMLYLMNIAKMIFPLVTLPYLTRVLTVECYAIVAYVKAVMQYVQIVLMFGFSLSATKDIVNAAEDKREIGAITGSVLEAKGVLSIIAAAVLLVLTAAIPLLRENPLFTALAFINIVITEMLADFLFRGIDKMEIITIRFVASKLISTVLTFVFIKNDNHVLLIPLFDILGSVAALALVLIEIHNMGIIITKMPLSDALSRLKESAIYFASNMATTAFGALNTLLVGIFVKKTDVSYWSLCMQLISAVQSLYAPITNGIYPSMVRTKSLKLLKKILLVFMPVVVGGCIICVLLSNFIVTLIGGPQYTDAAPVFRMLVPVLLFSFPGMLLGWPALGAIGKQKDTTMTTIITAFFQICGLGVLIVTGKFDLINIAILRGITEGVMMLLRGGLCIKYRNEFVN